MEPQQFDVFFPKGQNTRVTPAELTDTAHQVRNTFEKPIIAGIPNVFECDCQKSGQLKSLKLTAKAPDKKSHPKRNIAFQPFIFRCENVGFRECKILKKLDFLETQDRSLSLPPQTFEDFFYSRSMSLVYSSIHGMVDFYGTPLKINMEHNALEVWKIIFLSK